MENVPMSARRNRAHSNSAYNNGGYENHSTENDMGNNPAHPDRVGGQYEDISEEYETIIDEEVNCSRVNGGTVVGTTYAAGVQQNNTEHQYEDLVRGHVYTALPEGTPSPTTETNGTGTKTCGQCCSKCPWWIWVVVVILTVVVVSAAVSAAVALSVKFQRDTASTQDNENGRTTLSASTQPPPTTRVGTHQSRLPTTTPHRVFCPVLPAPQNGRISSGLNANTVNSVTTFTCNRDYELTGSSVLTCQQNGVWDGMAPVCNKILVTCTIPAEPNNGQRRVNGNGSSGTSVTFTCNQGYILQGTNVIWCQNNGQYDAAVPVCVSILCPPLLAPQNGRIIGRLNGNNVEAVTTFECDSGYQLTGSIQRICQPNGVWSGMAPVCKSVFCTPLSPPQNGIISIGHNENTVKSVTHFGCNRGYELAGSAYRICQKNGAWDGVEAICNPVSNIRCPRLSVPNLIHVGYHTYEGAVLRVHCLSGFTVEQDSEMIGCFSGNWIPTIPTCQPVQCPPLVIPNGVFTPTTRTYDTQVNVQCNPGFTIVGSSVTTCKSASFWRPLQPTCTRTGVGAANCPRLTIPNANLGNNGLRSRYVNVKCIEGTQLQSGTSFTTLVCVEGRWSQNPLPTCTAIHCVDLAIPNAVFSPRTTTVGTLVNVQCNLGFQLLGYSVITCSLAGRWAPFVPVCTHTGS